MDLLEILEIFENTELERTVASKTNGEDMISYIPQLGNTCTIRLNNETTVNNVHRVCFKATSDDIIMYIVHITVSHYTKYDVAEIESVEVL